MTDDSTANRTVDSTINRIKQRQARIGIIGLGYVGLPLALLYSEQKFQLTGFDIDARKVDILAKGGSYIYRIAAEEIHAAKANGFSATADFSQISAMDVIIICVPTPLNEYHEPDLSYITDTTHSIAPHLRAGQLVVLESTTYPGTTEDVMVPILEKENQGGLKAARNGALEVVLRNGRPLDPLADPEGARRMVGRLVDAGATGLQVWFAHRSLAHYLEQLEAMAELIGSEGLNEGVRP